MTKTKTFSLNSPTGNKLFLNLRDFLCKRNIYLFLEAKKKTSKGVVLALSQQHKPQYCVQVVVEKSPLNHYEQQASFLHLFLINNNVCKSLFISTRVYVCVLLFIYINQQKNTEKSPKICLQCNLLHIIKYIFIIKNKTLRSIFLFTGCNLE